MGGCSVYVLCRVDLDGVDCPFEEVDERDELSVGPDVVAIAWGDEDISHCFLDGVEVRLSILTATALNHFLS